MKKFKWLVRSYLQTCFPTLTLALLSNRTWLLEAEIALLPLLANNSGMAIDVGANKGVYLYHLSRHYRSVFAFEPLPYLAACLKRSALKNVQVACSALSDHEGHAVLSLPRGYNELGSLEQHTAETWTTDEPCEKYDVRVRPLDAYEFDNVALLKIDVEGHELAVLRGAVQTINRCRPAILIEAEDRHHPNAVALTRKILEGLGYRGYYVDGRTLRSVALFDARHDQNLSSLRDSVKVGRYLNNFIYFHSSEASQRAVAVQSAILGQQDLEFSEVLRPRSGATLRNRLKAPLRTARDLARIAAIGH